MDLREIKQAVTDGHTLNGLPLSVAYYARVSTDREEQQNSLENQISYFDDFIGSRKNWTFAGRYIDEGISGSSVNKREDFLRMIADAKAGKMNLILTKEISRFSRSTLDSIKYTRDLLLSGTGVLFINDNICTLSPDAELRLTIMASLAQEELRRLSDRVKFGMKRAYESGKVLGNDSLYGYKKANGKLEIDEETAPFIRDLYRIYGEGKHGFRSLVRVLTDMGYLNQKGASLNPGTLRQIMRNPKYKGYYYGRLTESSDYQTQKNIELPEEERLYYKDENIPALVSEALWDKVNNLLNSRAGKFQKKTGAQERYTYSQKIICGIHGAHHYRKVWKDRKIPVESWCCKEYLAHGRIACPTPHLHTKELDIVMEAIGRQFILNRKAITDELIGLYQGITLDTVDFDKEISKTTKAIQKENDKKQRLLELCMEGAIGKDDFKKMNADINAACAKFEKKLGELDSQKKRMGDTAAMYNDARRICEDIAEGKIIPLEIARAMLDKITVEPGSTNGQLKLTVSLKYQPDFPAEIVRAASRKTSATSCIVIGKNPVTDKISVLLIPASSTLISDGETEVSPIVGSEKQSEELVMYLLKEFEENPKQIWASNIFGTSLHELVNEGLHNKLYRMPADARMKLQETIERIINEGCSGLICIII